MHNISKKEVIFLKQFREKQPEILEVPSTHFGLESNFVQVKKKRRKGNSVGRGLRLKRRIQCSSFRR